ncbi:hypothetical protein A6P55_04155 [Pandoraea pnomenusa]|nr:hypothetical protein A6P55_04155 [Pandoraea pnomenusa]
MRTHVAREPTISMRSPHRVVGVASVMPAVPASSAAGVDVDEAGTVSDSAGAERHFTEVCMARSSRSSGVPCTSR